MSNPLSGATKSWFCYILKCADGSYYVGVATDLEERVEEHNKGYAAKHTRLRTPVALVWSQQYPNYAEARAAEARLKGWRKEKKTQLILGSLRLD